jgi:5'-3' exonuclease
MEYLLIDGNNLAVRASFANESLQNQEGVPTGVHYGVFNSLISLKKKFPEHQFLIVWDGKSKRRVAEAQQGVEQGLVPSGYKKNRNKGDDIPKPLQDFYAQSSYLQRGIGKTGIPQIRLPEFEADDIIASYAKILKKHNKVIVVTSDKDYWQILDEQVSLWDGMKEIKTTKSSWAKEYGLSPERAIDMGALVGDSGDNIFGIPGWGEKTAVKELKKYGAWEDVLKAYHNKYDSLRQQYPDLIDEEEFKKLASIKSDPKKPTSRVKFPEIRFGMPFTGVCKAFHEGKIKLPKVELMALMFEDRVRLAYSLKKMDDDITDLPTIEAEECDKNKVIEYFEYYDIYSLHDDINIFTDDANVDPISEDTKAIEDTLIV